jgi:hypothetical protein
MELPLVLVSAAHVRSPQLTSEHCCDRARLTASANRCPLYAARFTLPVLRCPRPGRQRKARMLPRREITPAVWSRGATRAFPQDDLKSIAKSRA